MFAVEQFLNIQHVVLALEIFALIYSILLLITYQRRSTTSASELTETLIERSWSSSHVAIMTLTFFGSMTLLPLTFFAMGIEGDKGSRIASTMLPSLIQFLVLWHIATERKRAWSHDFGMTVRSLKRAPLALAICIATLPLIGLASYVYQQFLQSQFGMELNNQEIVQMIIKSRTWARVGLTLTTVLIAPLVEELFFRGILFPYLTRKIGLTPSIFLISLVFSVVHFHIPSALAIFLLSNVLCIAYWRTRTLWTSITIHALFNSFSLINLFFGAQ